MKKNNLYLVCCFLLSSVLIFSCCEKPSEPIVKPIIIPPDIDDDRIRIPSLPYGGDPRGTYYPNTPLVRIGGNGYISPAIDVVTPTVNGGSGKLIIEGASATTGTWRTENFFLQFDGKLKLNTSPYPISTVNHDSLAKFFRQGAGRWGVNPSFTAQIVFSNRTSVEDFPFTVDSLGMYFYTSPPRISFPPDANTILCTTIFKKQR